MKKKTVVVVGLWHLGLVNAIGFAEKGYRVIGLEFSAVTVRKLRAGRLPLFEPGLAALVKKHTRSGRLTFSDRASAVAKADYAVIAYDTPVTENDEVDLTPIVSTVKAIARHMPPTTPLVITSQVPIGTCRRFESMVKKANRKWRSGVAYTPENLKLGQAIARFLAPDMLVLGTNTTTVTQAVTALYRPFRTQKILTTLETAEMVKHALNAFLAVSISFINEIAQLSARLGADAVVVGNALRHDQRIGRRALLSPGLGFSGGTLARDVVQLCKIAQKQHYPAQLLSSIIPVNEATYMFVISQLQRHLGTLKKKKIGILGLTYKPGTSTMRRSPAIKIIEKLRRAGAACYGYDPKADVAEVRQHRHLFKRLKTLSALASDVEALVLVTEWPEFKEQSYERIADLMSQPVLIDTKNFLDPVRLRAAGFTYYGFGRP